MRFCLFAFLPIAMLFTGCASSCLRNEPLYELSAAPMSDSEWNKNIGIYSGPVRSRVHTWMGTTGEQSEEVSLSVRGTALHPKIYLRIRANYTTAWTGLGSKADVYTNIPRLEYGAKVLQHACTHAPNVLVLGIPKRIYIMRFTCRDTIEIDEIGIHGWRGVGRLQRVPEFPCPEESKSRGNSAE